MTSTLASDPIHVGQRSDRLSAASLRTVIEPETDLPWDELGTGPLGDQLIADELLTTAGLDVELTADQKARLSREEIASMMATGIRFEAGLMAGFGTLLTRCDPADPRVFYMLHELGEETRHSRAFARVVRELDPQADNPLNRGAPERFRRRVLKAMMNQPALLTVFVLAGEEIPDLLQKIAAEHPDTDPLIVAINRYHRQEEARHLAFARMTLAEHWAQASRRERRRVRHFAPRAIGVLFAALVNPGVYRTIGLPPFRTWRAVQKTPERVALRYEGTRPVLKTLLDVGVLRRGRVPRAWQRLCGVDRFGEVIS